MKFNSISSIQEYTLDSVIEKLESERGLQVYGLKSAFERAQKELSALDAAIEGLTTHTMTMANKKIEFSSVENVHNFVLLARGLRDLEGVKTIRVNDEQDICQFLIDYTSEKHPDLLKKFGLMFEDGFLTTTFFVSHRPTTSILPK